MRCLGIDYGLKRIGLALGDGDTRLAVPLETILNRGTATITSLAARIGKEQIDQVVVGIPVQDRPEWSRTQIDAVEKFIAQLRVLTTVPIATEDERFTTSESKRMRREQGSKVSEDALAAMLILQQYLDHLS